MPKDDDRRMAAEPPVVCSFCGKSQAQIDKLIAGPGVYICNECVDLCCDILSENQPAEGERERMRE